MIDNLQSAGFRAKKVACETYMGYNETANLAETLALIRDEDKFKGYEYEASPDSGDMRYQNAYALFEFENENGKHAKIDVRETEFRWFRKRLFIYLKSNEPLSSGAIVI